MAVRDISGVIEILLCINVGPLEIITNLSSCEWKIDDFGIEKHIYKLNNSSFELLKIGLHSAERSIPSLFDL